MASIRIFLLTYRRPRLLARALASLRAQTFTDWICELHNDDPADDAPTQLVAAAADPRITLYPHARNWGPVASFNHAFACAGPEPFGALLEDDNAWEPGFLATALAALAAQPAAAVAWANLRLWRERTDGGWEDTGRTVWQAPANARPVLFHAPLPLQFSDALHSNGAMVFRANASRRALVPADTPFAVIEPARERLIEGGWLFLPQPLAIFGITCESARSRSRASWAQAQMLVAASHLLAHPEPEAEIARQWRRLRAESPSPLSLLFHLALAGVHRRTILRHAMAREWLRFALGALRHPHALAAALRFRRAHPGAWAAMSAGARARADEHRRSGRPPGVLERKILP